MALYYKSPKSRANFRTRRNVRADGEGRDVFLGEFVIGKLDSSLCSFACAREVTMRENTSLRALELSFSG